jgi:two-component system, NarL family, nitrate/nitrite response regulator NarL
LLEDHRIVRESLASGLEASGVQVIGAYGDTPSFLAGARRGEADVALVDITLEGPNGGDGLSALQALPGVAPSIRAVVLSASHDPAVVEKAYQLGACAYLHKLDADCARIVSTLRAASRGERMADGRAFEDALRKPPAQRDAADPLGVLTDRERDVLACVASGADNLKIAAILNITERTVRAHVSSLYRKLGHENRAELAIFARDLGIKPRTQ